MKFFTFDIHRRNILRLALPAIAGLSTQMLLSLVDTAMVGRLPNAEYSLAAMGIGFLATWAVVSFFSSLATGTHVLIARHFGRKNYKECGDVLNTSLIISIILGISVAFLIVYFAFDIADFFAVDKTVGHYAGEYLFYRFLGIPFFLISASYRGFYFGIGKTKIFMYSGILTNLLNIIFDYIFIYGDFGIKGMGLAGAGLGSSLATIIDSLFYFVISTFKSYREKFKYFKKFKYNSNIANSIVKIALPVSFQNIFTLTGFLVFIAITGLIGTLQQAASQITVSAMFLSLMPSFGFGIAAQTFVGNKLGQNNVSLAKFYGFETSKIATAYTIFIGIIFVLFPKIILLALTKQNNIIVLAIPILRIAGFAQVFFGVGIVLASGLQSAGESFFVMMSDIIVNWVIFIPLAYILGVVMHFGIIGAWSVMPLYTVLYAIVIFLKFKYGRWIKYKD